MSRWKVKRQNAATLEAELHPLIASLCREDPILFYDDAYNHLSVEELQLISLSTPLYALQKEEASHSFYLLAPEPMLAVLKQHPAAKKLSMTVNVLILEPSDTIETLTTTLLLTLPAIKHRFQPLYSFNTLNQRYGDAKSHRLPLPTKKTLADLAGCCNSNFK